MTRTTGDLRLEGVNLDEYVELEEMRRQRLLCGWNYDPTTLQKWNRLIKSGDRLMWWIFADNDPDPPVEYEIPNFVIANGDNANPPPRNPDFAPIGHIALDAIDYAAPDPKQRVGEEGTMIISTFFILKSRQGKKYGRYAMDLVEKRAKEVHGCKALSLNTMPARVILDPEHWRRQGAEYDPSSQPVNELWYQRRGYVAYKEEPRYRVPYADGTVPILPAVFMKKEL